MEQPESSSGHQEGAKPAKVRGARAQLPRLALRDVHAALAALRHKPTAAPERPAVQDLAYSEAAMWFTKPQLKRFAACLEKTPFLWRADHLTCKKMSILRLAYIKLLEMLDEPTKGTHCVPWAMALCRVFIILLREQLQSAAHESQARGKGLEEALQLCPRWARHANSYLQLMPDIFTHLQKNATPAPTGPSVYDFDTDSEQPVTTKKQTKKQTRKYTKRRPRNQKNTKNQKEILSVETFVDVCADLETEIDVDLRNFATNIMGALTDPLDNDFGSDQEAEINVQLRNIDINITNVSTTPSPYEENPDNKAEKISTIESTAPSVDDDSYNQHEKITTKASSADDNSHSQQEKITTNEPTAPSIEDRSYSEYEKITTNEPTAPSIEDRSYSEYEKITTNEPTAPSIEDRSYSEYEKITTNKPTAPSLDDISYSAHEKITPKESTAPSVDASSYSEYEKITTNEHTTPRIEDSSYSEYEKISTNEPTEPSIEDSSYSEHEKITTNEPMAPSIDTQDNSSCSQHEKITTSECTASSVGDSSYSTHEKKSTSPSADASSYSEHEKITTNEPTAPSVDDISFSGHEKITTDEPTAPSIDDSSYSEYQKITTIEPTVPSLDDISFSEHEKITTNEPTAPSVDASSYSEYEEITTKESTAQNVDDNSYNEYESTVTNTSTPLCFDDDNTDYDPEKTFAELTNVTMAPCVNDNCHLESEAVNDPMVPYVHVDSNDEESEINVINISTELCGRGYIRDMESEINVMNLSRRLYINDDNSDRDNEENADKESREPEENCDKENEAIEDNESTMTRSNSVEANETNVDNISMRGTPCDDMNYDEEVSTTPHDDGNSNEVTEPSVETAIASAYDVINSDNEDECAAPAAADFEDDSSDDERENVTQLCRALMRRWIELQNETKSRLRSHLRVHTATTTDTVVEVDLSDEDQDTAEPSCTEVDDDLRRKICDDPKNLDRQFQMALNNLKAALMLNEKDVGSTIEEVEKGDERDNDETGNVFQTKGIMVKANNENRDARDTNSVVKEITGLSCALTGKEEDVVLRSLIVDALTIDSVPEKETDNKYKHVNEMESKMNLAINTKNKSIYNRREKSRTKKDIVAEQKIEEASPFENVKKGKSKRNIIASKVQKSHTINDKNYEQGFLKVNSKIKSQIKNERSKCSQKICSKRRRSEMLHQNKPNNKVYRRKHGDKGFNNAIELVIKSTAALHLSDGVTVKETHIDTSKEDLEMSVVRTRNYLFRRTYFKDTVFDQELENPSESFNSGISGSVMPDETIDTNAKSDSGNDSFYDDVKEGTVDVYLTIPSSGTRTLKKPDEETSCPKSNILREHHVDKNVPDLNKVSKTKAFYKRKRRKCGIKTKPRKEMRGIASQEHFFADDAVNENNFSDHFDNNPANIIRDHVQNKKEEDRDNNDAVNDRDNNMSHCDGHNTAGIFVDPKLSMRPVVVLKRVTTPALNLSFTPNCKPVQQKSRSTLSQSSKSTFKRSGPKFVKHKRSWKKPSKSKEDMNKDKSESIVTKRVKLPDIEEVRRKNKKMLTAQVTPITHQVASLSPEMQNSERLANTTMPPNEDLPGLITSGLLNASCEHGKSTASVASSLESCVQCTAQRLSSSPDEADVKPRRGAAARARSFITSYAASMQPSKHKPEDIDGEPHHRKRNQRGHSLLRSISTDDATSIVNENAPADVSRTPPKADDREKRWSHASTRSVSSDDATSMNVDVVAMDVPQTPPNPACPKERRARVRLAASDHDSAVVDVVSTRDLITFEDDETTIKRTHISPIEATSVFVEDEQITQDLVSLENNQVTSLNPVAESPYNNSTSNRRECSPTQEPTTFQNDPETPRSGGTDATHITPVHSILSNDIPIQALTTVQNEEVKTQRSLKKASHLIALPHKTASSDIISVVTTQDLTSIQKVKEDTSAKSIKTGVMSRRKRKRQGRRFTSSKNAPVMLDERDLIMSDKGRGTTSGSEPIPNIVSLPSSVVSPCRNEAMPSVTQKNRNQDTVNVLKRVTPFTCSGASSALNDDMATLTLIKKKQSTQPCKRKRQDHPCFKSADMVSSVHDKSERNPYLITKSKSNPIKLQDTLVTQFVPSPPTAASTDNEKRMLICDLIAYENDECSLKPFPREKVTTTQSDQQTTYFDIPSSPASSLSDYEPTSDRVQPLENSDSDNVTYDDTIILSDDELSVLTTKDFDVARKGPELNNVKILKHTVLTTKKNFGKTPNTVLASPDNTVKKLKGSVLTIQDINFEARKGPILVTQEDVVKVLKGTGLTAQKCDIKARKTAALASKDDIVEALTDSVLTTQDDIVTAHSGTVFATQDGAFKPLNGTESTKQDEVVTALEGTELATQDDMVTTLRNRRKSTDGSQDPSSRVPSPVKRQKKSALGFKPLLYRQKSSVPSSSLLNKSEIFTQGEQEQCTGSSDRLNDAECFRTVVDDNNWIESEIENDGASPTVQPLTEENLANIDSNLPELSSNVENSNMSDTNEEFHNFEVLDEPAEFSPVIVSVQSLAPQQELTNESDLQPQTVQPNSTITSRQAEPISLNSKNVQGATLDNSTENTEVNTNSVKATDVPVRRRHFALTKPNNIQTVAWVSGPKEKSPLTLLTLKQAKRRRIFVSYPTTSIEVQKVPTNSVVFPSGTHSPKIFKVAKIISATVQKQISNRTTPVPGHLVKKHPKSLLNLPNSVVPSSKSQVTEASLKFRKILPKNNVPEQINPIYVEALAPKSIQQSNLPKITLKKAQPVYVSYQNSHQSFVTAESPAHVSFVSAEKIQEGKNLPRVVDVTGDLHVMQPDNQMGLHLVVSQPQVTSDVSFSNIGINEQVMQPDDQIALRVVSQEEETNYDSINQMSTDETMMQSDEIGLNVVGSQEEVSTGATYETVMQSNQIGLINLFVSHDKGDKDNLPNINQHDETDMRTDEQIGLNLISQEVSTNYSSPNTNQIYIDKTIMHPDHHTGLNLLCHENMVTNDGAPNNPNDVAVNSNNPPKNQTLNGVPRRITLKRRHSLPVPMFVRSVQAGADSTKLKRVDVKTLEELLAMNGRSNPTNHKKDKEWSISGYAPPTPSALWAAGRPREELVVLCVGPAAWTTRGARPYLLLSERAPPPTEFALWTISPRQGLELPEGQSYTLESPPRKVVDGIAYQKISDDPVTYAKLVVAVSDAGGCRELLARRAPLMLYCLRTCQLYPLRAEFLKDPPRYQLTGDAAVAEPLVALQRELSQLEPIQAPLAPAHNTPPHPTTPSTVAPTSSDARTSTSPANSNESTLTAPSRPATPSTLSASSPDVSPVLSPRPALRTPSPAPRSPRPGGSHAPFASPPRASPSPEPPAEESDLPDDDDAQTPPPDWEIIHSALTVQPSGEPCAKWAVPDDQFLASYRLPKERAKALVEELRPLLPPMELGDMEPDDKVLTCLNFLATGRNPESVNTCAAIAQVVDALNQDRFYKARVRFPEAARERADIKRRFYQAFKLPRVVGAMGSVHVPIMEPDEDEKEYFNGVFHSLNVQIICDSEQRIMSVDSTHGGGVHNCAVWLEHQLNYHIKFLQTKNLEKVCLLGDSGYPQLESVLTPIESPKSREDLRYNTMHDGAYSAIRKCIYALKARWRCLSVSSETTAPTPAVASTIVGACAVLHNLALDVELPVDSEWSLAERRAAAAVARVAGGAARYLRSARGAAHYVGRALERGRAVQRSLVRQLQREERLLWGGAGPPPGSAEGAAPELRMRELLAALRQGREERAALLQQARGDAVVLDDDEDDELQV